MPGNSPLFRLMVACNPELLPQRGLIARLCQRAEQRGIAKPYSPSRLRHYLRAGQPQGARHLPSETKCAELARVISGEAVRCTPGEVRRAIGQTMGIDLAPNRDREPLYLGLFGQLAQRDQDLIVVLMRAMLTAPSPYGATRR